MSDATTLELLESPANSKVPISAEFEDASPFGLQGLPRQSLRILKPDCVVKLAITLALRGTRAQIRDPDFVERELSFHPDWIDEYQIVHLIEKSLWLQGHSNLVMTMTRNPSQIPDNPPAKIMRALSRAYTLHPDATIWYGVPLFSEEQNEEGLPIPVTAEQVRTEANRRIKAAQRHALRWRWMYRAALQISRIPSHCRRLASGICQSIGYSFRRIRDYWRKTRADVRRRERARIQAQLEVFKQGFSTTVVPQHTTWLGRSLDTAALGLELLAYQASFVVFASPFVGAAAVPLGIASFAPILFVPVTVVSCDPFLFVELPDEPGKLRHLGHWYWQTKEGRKKLHLHV